MAGYFNEVTSQANSFPQGRPLASESIVYWRGVERSRSPGRSASPPRLQRATVAQPELVVATEYSAADLEEYARQLFMIGDANGDGVLQPDELRR